MNVYGTYAFDMGLNLYDTLSELRFGVPNPDFALGGVSGVVAGQQLVTPRQFRVGLRYEF